MSASAPLGRPSKNTGSVDADCTSATRIGELVSVVISQAAATSFIHMQVLAVTQVSHNMRNTGIVSGASAVIDALWPSGAASCASRAATDSSVPRARAAHSAAAAAAASDEGAGPGGAARILPGPGPGRRPRLRLRLRQRTRAQARGVRQSIRGGTQRYAYLL